LDLCTRYWYTLYYTGTLAVVLYLCTMYRYTLRL
jgi:hypothetical protein